jgi:hypothetical protein
MKYSAFIYNEGNVSPIGEVKATSIDKLKNAARIYAVNYNGKGGRIIVEDRATGRRWNINS